TPSKRASGAGGPSSPGIASWRNDGTVGMQFDTESPASRSAATLLASSSGSSNSHTPIASKTAAADAARSSADEAFSVEIVESDSFTSVLEALQADDAEAAPS